MASAIKSALPSRLKPGENEDQEASFERHHGKSRSHMASIPFPCPPFFLSTVPPSSKGVLCFTVPSLSTLLFTSWTSGPDLQTVLCNKDSKQYRAVTMGGSILPRTKSHMHETGMFWPPWLSRASLFSWQCSGVPLLAVNYRTRAESLRHPSWFLFSDHAMVAATAKGPPTLFPAS